MKGPELLQAFAGRLRTRMGACFPGTKAIFRSYDLHAELGDFDWIELYVFGILGRRFSAEQLRLLHAMWVYTSYPDARIWNNRVAALAATARSTPSLGLAAALAVSEATIYGGFPFVRAIDFLLTAQDRIQKGEDLDDIVNQELQMRRIYGFGRPINSTDERLSWLLALRCKLDLDQGPHVPLAFEIERVLLSHRDHLRLNYAGLTAAIAADLGFSRTEFHLFTFPIFLAGMPPCFTETAQRPEGSLFPLSCTSIQYEGNPKRSWRHQ